MSLERYRGAASQEGADDDEVTLVGSTRPECISVSSGSQEQQSNDGSTEVVDCTGESPAVDDPRLQGAGAHVASSSRGFGQAEGGSEQAVHTAQREASQRAEQERLARQVAVQLAEEEHLANEARQAAAQRAEQERLANEARQAAVQCAEQARLAMEAAAQCAEEARVANEARQAAVRRAEQERLATEAAAQRAEQEHLERKAAQKDPATLEQLEAERARREERPQLECDQSDFRTRAVNASDSRRADRSHERHSQRRPQGIVAEVQHASQEGQGFFSWQTEAGRPVEPDGSMQHTNRDERGDSGDAGRHVASAASWRDYDPDTTRKNKRPSPEGDDLRQRLDKRRYGVAVDAHSEGSGFLNLKNARSAPGIKRQRIEFRDDDFRDLGGGPSRHASSNQEVGRCERARQQPDAMRAGGMRGARGSREEAGGFIPRTTHGRSARPLPEVGRFVKALSQFESTKAARGGTFGQFVGMQGASRQLGASATEQGAPQQPMRPGPEHLAQAALTSKPGKGQSINEVRAPRPAGEPSRGAGKSAEALHAAQQGPHMTATRPAELILERAIPHTPQDRNMWYPPKEQEAAPGCRCTVPGYNAPLYIGGRKGKDRQELLETLRQAPFVPKEFTNAVMRCHEVHQHYRVGSRVVYQSTNITDHQHLSAPTLQS